MRIFVDTCIAKRIVKALRELSYRESEDVADRLNITHLEELFPADIPDVEWIRRLRESGEWVIVSGDPRITRNPAERAAWIESRLTGFFFEELTSHKFWVQAREMVHWWPTICETARKATPGTGFLIKFKAKELKTIYEPW